jgi:hypothetical protein
MTGVRLRNSKRQNTDDDRLVLAHGAGSAQRWERAAAWGPREAAAPSLAKPAAASWITEAWQRGQLIRKADGA